MKNILVMGCVGIGLFSATVVGLLGAQGRLNYEGTRHLPLLRSLFDAPAGTKSPQPQPRRHKKPAADPGIDKSSVDRRSTSPAAVGTEDPEFASRPPSPEQHPGLGTLFNMSKIEASGMTVDEVNEIVERARSAQRELAEDRAALLKLSRELSVRERDLAARHQRVSQLMQDVLDERARVEGLIADFNRKVIEISVDEEAGLREAAQTIAKLTPAAAAELILDFWKDEGGKARVVKLLAVMDAERADEIIAQLDTRLVREILEKRMSVARPGAKRRPR